MIKIFCGVFSNDNVIHCISSMVALAANTSYVESPLVIQLASGFTLQTKTTFKVKPNPIIYTISPRRTFLR